MGFLLKIPVFNHKNLCILSLDFKRGAIYLYTQNLIPMKQIVFTVIGSFVLFTATTAGGNVSSKTSAKAAVKATVAPQSNFAFVRGHRKGKGTSLAWGMDGAGASKFYVSRSYDFDPYDPYAVWEDVTVMDANNSRSYKVDDENVFPGTIHYRIVAVMTDGSSVTAPLTSIRIIKR